MKKPPILLFLLLNPQDSKAAPAPEPAEFERTAPASPDGTIVVESVCGSVEITAQEDARVDVRGHTGVGRERLVFEPGKERTSIRLELPERRNCDGSLLQIKAPKGSRFEVRTVSAEVKLTGATGALDIHTTSGGVRVTGTSKEIEVESVSGELEIDADRPQMKAETVSGNITLRMAGGAFELQSVSGDIKTRAQSYAKMQAKTVSGDIDVEGALDSSGRFTFTSQSGDVELRVPKGQSGMLSLRSFSGTIHADGAETHEQSFGPGKSAKMSLAGGAGPQIDISTHSGDVRIDQR